MMYGLANLQFMDEDDFEETIRQAKTCLLKPHSWLIMMMINFV